MRHVISSIFNAVVGFRTGADDVQPCVASRRPTSSMVALNLDQLHLVAGGDAAQPDGLPKGGWKATSSSSA